MAKYRISYQLNHANGALVDASDDTPLEFELGDGQLDPCLESCVATLQAGDEQTFLLTADQAFGPVYDEAFQAMDRADFPKDLAIELDNVVEFQTPADEAYVGRIHEIEGDQITIDFNHPLAGANVSFQVQVLDKTE